MSKKVLIISDLHCGSVVGLTHPNFDTGEQGHAAIREAHWFRYKEMLEEIGRVDVLVVNGDCIDGKSSHPPYHRFDVMTNRPYTQIEMAVAASFAGCRGISLAPGHQ